MKARNASIAALAAALIFSTGGAFANGGDSKQPIEDSVITTKVKAKLIQDDTTKARHINVTTKNGMVTLMGTVDTEMERDQAALNAQKIEGVVSVDNKLNVKQ